MPSVTIGFGRLFQLDIFQEPSVCGKVISWCRRRHVLVFVAAVVLLALLAVGSRIGVPTAPDGDRRPPDSAASLIPGELTVDLIAAISSMDLPTDGSRKRFTKNCTMTSPTTGRTESIVLLPAVGLGSDAQPDGAGGGDGGGGASFARIIHRMWKTEQVPASWSDGASSCRLVNPDHSYCHWTDDELDAFIGAEYSWFLSTYRGYTYDIQRVDAARYFVLYHYGGTYLDLDLVCRRPLAHLLNVAGSGSSAALTTGGDTLTDEVVLVETLPVGVTNEFMAVRRARDPFMRNVVVGLRPNAELWYVFSYPTIMFSTGPMYLSNRLWQMQAALNQTAGGRNGDGSGGGHGNGTRVRIIERRLFLGEHFVHLVGSSWHRWDGIVIWTFFRLRYYLLAAGIVVALCAVYYLVRRLEVSDLSGSRRMSFARRPI